MDIEYLIRNEMLKKHKKVTDIIKYFGTTKQNFYVKLKRGNNMKISDLEKFADALDCELSIQFIPRNTDNNSK